MTFNIDSIGRQRLKLSLKITETVVSLFFHVFMANKMTSNDHTKRLLVGYTLRVQCFFQRRKKTTTVNTLTTNEPQHTAGWNRLTLTETVHCWEWYCLHVTAYNTIFKRWWWWLMMTVYNNDEIRNIDVKTPKTSGHVNLPINQVWVYRLSIKLSLPELTLALILTCKTPNTGHIRSQFPNLTRTATHLP